MIKQFGDDLYCPTCGPRNQNLRCLGNIPACDTFADRTLSESILGDALYECLICALKFRYPQLQASELNRLYREGRVDHWSVSEDKRKDWKIARHFFMDGKMK